MRIQPAVIPVTQEINFGQKRPSTKIPGNLNVKPKPKGPSAFFIGLVSIISLLAGGTWLYRQTFSSFGLCAVFIHLSISVRNEM